jgi:two-component system, OmpR family, response regulator
MPNTTNKQKISRVLIVEEQPDICLLLNIMLKERDIEVEHVKSLSEAKQYLENESPDIILLDNRLPDGLGLDFIPFVRNNYPNIKIIMISGYHADVIKDVALDNGADVFIEKPFTKHDIFEAVHQLLTVPEQKMIA